MATYDLEEQEQIDELKTWWKQHGNKVTALLLAASLGVAAWQGWGWYQRSQAAQASMVFHVLQKAASEGDMQRLKAASGELLEKFSGTTYAPLGALLSAKAAYVAGDLKTARAQLTWASSHGESEVRDLARLRLAAVMLDEKAFDEALQQVASPASRAMAARFAEMRGDILLAQGKRAEAKAAYQDVLQKIGTAAAADRKTAAEHAPAFREVVQQKLDALGDA